uniref:Uncharacterized protein n=1 Tax=Lotharella oceanica TaxID=641309 RepID=A0A7S2XFN4_9EUKA|eukprot:CAMPEP_0170178212 /NCGR_PEP_ID=MMETSP0040_2-20121228/11740_1 /TAXON_ID=641309 /ORGANISM="Lotharella oceanica, Strain CCMP622" /LENGTH=103 /DNA_ID=CAMNT_0010421211 /DNA_START=24 /DNA_END=335 /DNA_ORIENTATION=-
MSGYNSVATEVDVPNKSSKNCVVEVDETTPALLGGMDNDCPPELKEAFEKHQGRIACCATTGCLCCPCTLGLSCFLPHCYIFCCMEKELQEAAKAGMGQATMS